MPDHAAERDPEVQRLLDKEAIRDVLMRYCRGIDRCDPDLVASAYHPDAHDDHLGKIFQGPTLGRDLVEWVGAIFYAMSHGITTHVIDVQGDKAAAESYGTAFDLQEVGGERKLMLTITRYIDRLEKRGGEWRIADRLVVSDGTGYVPFDQIPVPPLSRQDRSDPSYAAFESLSPQRS